MVIQDKKSMIKSLKKGLSRTVIDSNMIAYEYDVTIRLAAALFEGLPNKAVLADRPYADDAGHSMQSDLTIKNTSGKRKGEDVHVIEVKYDYLSSILRSDRGRPSDIEKKYYETKPNHVSTAWSVCVQPKGTIPNIKTLKQIKSKINASSTKRVVIHALKIKTSSKLKKYHALLDEVGFKVKNESTQKTGWVMILIEKGASKIISLA